MYNKAFTGPPHRVQMGMQAFIAMPKTDSQYFREKQDKTISFVGLPWYNKKKSSAPEILSCLEHARKNLRLVIS